MSSTYADPHEERLRLAAFRWLEEQTTLHGEVLPWATLSRGFDLDGRRVPLGSMQRIFTPVLGR